jgi:hypothetical protein
MKDFLTDDEMEKLSTGSSTASSTASSTPSRQASQGDDFLTDEQMAAMSPQHPDEAVATAPSGPVVSDDQLDRMANPDHAAVNTMIRDAISRGMTKDQIIALAEANGVPNAGAIPLDAALEWRKTHGDYTGYVDAFGEPKPEIRTQPKNEVSTIDAIGQGVGQGLTFGFGDEIGAGIGAASNAVAGVFNGGTGEGMDQYYRRVRDENRDYLKDAEDENVAAYLGGELAGSIPTALIGGLGVSGARLAGRAALEGAAYGAGQSNADTAGGLVSDAALGGAVGGLTAGAMNRVGAVVSPRVAPLVDRLMKAGVELTPTQIMKAGGKVARTVGNAVETVGGASWLTSKTMRSAEGRAFASRDALQAQQDAAVAAAKAAGLKATPRHPDLLTDADKILSNRAKEASGEDKLLNLLLGYGTSGGTLAADGALASIYTKPGAAVANNLLTGRQGPVPKAIRSIATKLSPLAGNAASTTTPYTER